jgi:Spy/CpxP family protein refolding chaperone
MKTRTTVFLLAVLFALPFAAAAEAAQQRDPEAILSNPRALARYLRLTPEQANTTKGLLQTLHATVQPLRETGKGLREAFQAELEADAASACDVGQAALDLHANRELIQAARQTFDAAFSAILTPEQLARYEALKEAARLLRPGGDDEGE